LTSQILNQRLILEYANQYLADHPNPPSDFPRFLSQFQVTDGMMKNFLGMLAPKYGRMLSQMVKRDRDFMDYRSTYERSWETIQELTSATVYQLADSVRVSIPADSLRIHFKEKIPMSDAELVALKELIASKTQDAMQHDFKRDRDFLANLIKAELARIWYNGQTYYYQVRVQDDNQVVKAQTLFDQARQIAGLPKEAGQLR